jgi:hypothetical protein
MVREHQDDLIWLEEQPASQTGDVKAYRCVELPGIRGERCQTSTIEALMPEVGLWRDWRLGIQRATRVRMLISWKLMLVVPVSLV